MNFCKVATFRDVTTYLPNIVKGLYIIYSVQKTLLETSYFCQNRRISKIPQKWLMYLVLSSKKFIIWSDFQMASIDITQNR